MWDALHHWIDFRRDAIEFAAVPGTHLADQMFVTRVALRLKEDVPIVPMSYGPGGDLPDGCLGGTQIGRQGVSPSSELFTVYIQLVPMRAIGPDLWKTAGSHFTQVALHLWGRWCVPDVPGKYRIFSSCSTTKCARFFSMSIPAPPVDRAWPMNLIRDLAARVKSCPRFDERGRCELWVRRCGSRYLRWETVVGARSVAQRQVQEHGVERGLEHLRVIFKDGLEVGASSTYSGTRIFR